MTNARSVNVQVIPYYNLINNSKILVHMTPSDAIIYNTYRDNFDKLKKFINNIKPLSPELKYAFTISFPKNAILIDDLKFLKYAISHDTHILLDYIEYVNLKDLSIEPFKYAFCESPWIFLRLNHEYIINDVVDAWLDYVDFQKLKSDDPTFFAYYSELLCAKIQKLNKSLQLRFFSDETFMENIYPIVSTLAKQFIDTTLNE